MNKTILQIYLLVRVKEDDLSKIDGLWAKVDGPRVKVDDLSKSDGPWIKVDGLY